ncbi:hypothetical protein Xen7305DRAFT_00012020 [Xenococcus sp. PCC 7305]|uniref:hypothetical protein n=1 Tax=Xenococcus sp. PCC 7305 TaxID=102125 RepID=UPI0002ACF6DD|nr:hypothetical protein [Xenococcus sp. PCC 7305]ELS01498.1 hypothetical protein Xen7305DRAFT_00012020 [Xenococcus sp. PCC 7305]
MPDKSDPIGKGGSMPTASGGFNPRGGGGVGTNWKNIKWTRNKLVMTTIGLGLPYLIAVIITWMAGLALITYILISVAMLVGFIFLIVGWIDSDEF